MNRLMLAKFIVTILLGCAIAAAAAQDSQTNPPSAPYADALVSQWAGKVQLQLVGKPVAQPSRGERLPAGTIVDTQDGLMVLVLGDESQILLRPHTRLLLRQPGVGDWNYFEMLLGRIRASIRKRTGGAPPFQLGTPSAVIAVRGTRFDVEVNRQNVTEVDVFEGLVEVGAVGIPGSSVLVGPGFSTRVGMGGTPEPPIQTDEIRPDAQAPDQTMNLEFLREKAAESGLVSVNETMERPDSEINELEEESQEAIEGPHDADRDEPRSR